MMNRELNEEALQELYAWIDKIKLSRPKRNISRDFSDGGNSDNDAASKCNNYHPMKLSSSVYILHSLLYIQLLEIKEL